VLRGALKQGLRSGLFQGFPLYRFSPFFKSMHNPIRLIQGKSADPSLPVLLYIMGKEGTAAINGYSVFYF